MKPCARTAAGVSRPERVSAHPGHRGLLSLFLPGSSEKTVSADTRRFSRECPAAPPTHRCNPRSTGFLVLLILWRFAAGRRLTQTMAGSVHLRYAAVWME